MKKLKLRVTPLDPNEYLEFSTYRCSFCNASGFKSSNFPQPKCPDCGTPLFMVEKIGKMSIYGNANFMEFMNNQLDGLKDIVF